MNDRPFDWRAFGAAHPRYFKAAILAKKARAKVALILMLYCLGEGICNWEPPLDLLHPNWLVVMGLMLMAIGAGIRIAAHGQLRKKQELATDGVYSICRHPLYLGSILMALGFCILFNDSANYAFAGAYFLLFYPLTMVWEEFRLAERYGEAHAAYRATTPLLLPLGRFRGGEFLWAQALRNGGSTLLVGTCGLLLFAIEQVPIMHWLRH
ncbi:MAG: isoprenylcysteine carboxylmethyltransferase family protein [Planctomycetes bacterium]|nr:isoprenylcysteine carboxylmethyltransferase family protein [Planctomycetota bacterium]MBI3833082.1 isoprenylcysteine carboxylmethyltransferase family protein [Planctomycetota bacterium]